MLKTPRLELMSGGSGAEPFKTHNKALEAEFYLGI
jgi:lysyl-tRNA synthetase class II